MIQEVRMPQKGLTETSAFLSKWYVAVGDYVKAGEYLFALETSKSVFDVEAERDGKVLCILYPEGEEVEIEKIVCVLGDEGDVYEAEGGAGAAAGTGAAGDAGTAAAAQTAGGVASEGAAAAQANAVEGAGRVSEGAAAAQANAVEGAGAALTEGPASTGLWSAEQAIPVRTDAEGKRIFISPRAQALAAQLQIDYSDITPGGPEGRIVEDDVRRAYESGTAKRTAGAAAGTAAGTAAESAGAAGTAATGAAGTAGGKGAAAVYSTAKAPAASDTPYEDIPHTRIRKAIAQSMSQSMFTIPQLTHMREFDATEILAYRKRLKAHEDAGLSGITLNDIVIYAVSRILPRHPALNAHYYEDQLRAFKEVNMGIAVNTERGLMVPTIFRANRLSLEEIAKESRALQEEAKSGSLPVEKMSGATFTISNMGAKGAHYFTPIINPPQTGILGVCTPQKKLRLKDGAAEEYSSMVLALTYDHRAIDGSPANDFLYEVTHMLEHFTVLLAE